MSAATGTAQPGIVIITVAPTGGFLTKRDSPHVPTQPLEIAQDVYRCFNAGASVAALHARRPDDQATCDPTIYRRINDLIRERCDIVINNSTGGGLNGDLVTPGVGDRWESDRAARERGIEAGAEICSLNPMTVLATAGGRNTLFSTTPEQVLDLARRMKDRGIKPEWEAFSPTHLVQDIGAAVSAGLAGTPPLVNLCFGLDRVFQGAMPYSPRVLQLMTDLLPAGAVFSVSCGGPDQVAATTHGILLGGHVRTGLEDSIHGARGELLSNVSFVERTVRMVRELGLEPATPAQARAMLGLPLPVSSERIGHPTGVAS